MKTKELKELAEKFVVQLKKMAAAENAEQTTMLAKRTKEAEAYFVPLLKKNYSVISAHIDNLREEKKVKQYLSELIKLEGLFLDQIKKCRKASSFCECYVSGEILTREKTQTLTEQVQRTVTETTVNEKSAKKKSEKGDSVKETLIYFGEGKRAEEIAVLRNMSLTTIEGHLAQAVAAGQLAATALMAEEKIKAIHAAAEKMEQSGLKPLKEFLGEAFSYGELKIAMACFPKPAV